MSLDHTGQDVGVSHHSNAKCWQQNKYAAGFLTSQAAQVERSWARIMLTLSRRRSSANSKETSPWAYNWVVRWLNLTPLPAATCVHCWKREIIVPRLVNWVKLVQTAITCNTAECCHSLVCTGGGATLGPAFMLILMVVDSGRSKTTKPEKSLWQLLVMEPKMC